MANQRRSIRDIPITPKQRDSADGEQWKNESVPPQPRRDVEPIIDMTEEMLRVENPIEQADAVAHIDVKEQTKAPKKIRISDGTKPKSKLSAPRYAVEPAFMSTNDVVAESDAHVDSEQKHSITQVKKSKLNPVKKTWRTATLVALSLGIITVLLLTFIFNHATILVKNKSTTVALANTLLPIPVAHTTLSKNIEKTITIENPKMVTIQRKATGEVVLYNNFSTTPYDLVATTRLQTANGSVYRLLSDTKIPGKRTVNGKETPGSITVKVEADEAGDEYNARPGLDLRLPGLIKGTTRYQNIYAKTANQFTGGQTGQTIDTKSQAIADQIAKVKDEVKNEITQEFITSNPEFVVLPDSIQATHSIGTINVKNNRADIRIPITVKAIGLSKADLATAIDTYLEGQKVRIATGGDEGITFAVEKTDNATMVAGKFNVSATGDIPVVPRISNEEIYLKSIGRDAVEAASELDQMLAAEAEVQVDIWPFWSNKIPDNREKVDIKFE